MGHARKILSQAGTSLADVYDIEGSIAGLEELDVRDIKGVHDLGPQIHSERLLVFNLQIDGTAVLQSVNWGIFLGSFPDSINRVLSATVIADTAARVDFCSILIEDTVNDREHLIWAWDSADDVESRVRWNPGTGATTETVLRPSSNIAGGLPTLIARTGGSSAMPNLVFRGRSLAFGAGTVQALALIQVARPDRGAPSAGDPSSHGLPIPSW